MQSYPIYNLINRQEGGKQPNFGAREGFRQDNRVGTSQTNPHTLADITVTYDDTSDGKRLFMLFVDGKLIKSGVLNGKDFKVQS